MKFAIAGLWHSHTLTAWKHFRELLGGEAEMLGTWNIAPSLREGARENEVVPREFDSLEALLGARPDVVLTSHENCRKVDVVEAAAARGIPTYADKPLCTDRAGFDRIRMAVQNIPLGLQLELRYFPAMYEAARRVRRGDIGEVVSMMFQGPHKLDPTAREPSFLDAAVGGGAIIDLSIHDVDMAMWMGRGSPRLLHSVLAQRCGRASRPGFWDAGMLTFALDTGALCFVRVGWFTPRTLPKHGDTFAVIEGTRGTINCHFLGDPPGMLDEYKEYDTGYYDIFTMDAPPERVKCGKAPWVESDFLAQLAGEPHEVTKADILAATEFTITAHERAERLETPELPDPWSVGA